MDGPYRDKWGRIVYRVVIGGHVHKRRRDFDTARKLAQSYNGKVDELAGELQRKGEPVYEATASKGEGVFDTLKAVAKQVLTELRKG